MTPNVSIIIPNYNGGPLLAECVGSIQKSLRGPSYEIIVVDNASTDDSLKPLEVSRGPLRLIRQAENRGFASAVNAGAAHARYPFLMFLNSDTRVPPHTIDTLARYLEKESDCGICAPKLLNPDGSRQMSVGPFHSIKTVLVGIFQPKNERGYYQRPDDRPSAVDWASGACLMIRKSLFNRLGGFDERFFFNYEDADFCQRVWASKHSVVYLPQASILHHKGVSSRDPSVRERVMIEKRRSQLLFYQKHHPGWPLRFIKMANIAWALSRRLTGRLSRPQCRQIIELAAKTP